MTRNSLPPGYVDDTGRFADHLSPQKPDPVRVIGGESMSPWSVVAIAVVAVVLVIAVMVHGEFAHPIPPGRTWTVTMDGEEVIRLDSPWKPYVRQTGWSGPLVVCHKKHGVLCTVPASKTCRIIQVDP